jgi:hypothetical protein
MQIEKQADGRLTVFLEDKDGKVTECKDNDQVLLATGG